MSAKPDSAGTAGLLAPALRARLRNLLRGLALGSFSRKLALAYWSIAILSVALVGWVLERDLAARIDEQGQKILSLSHVLQEHTAQTLNEADHALRQLSEKARHIGTSNEVLLQSLMSDAAGEHFSRPRVFFINGSGHLYADSLGVMPAPLADPRAELDWHTRHPEGYSRLGTLIDDPATGTRMLPMTRRVNRADGSMLGVFGVMIDLREFERVYATLRLNSGCIQLLQDDHKVLLRYPDKKTNGLPQKDPLRRISQSENAQRAEGILFAAQSLKNWPLKVTVHSKLSTIRADWYPQVIRVGIAMGIVLAATWLMLRLLLEQLRRIEAGSEELKVTKFTLDQTSDAVYWVNSDGYFAFANPAAAQLFGLSAGQLSETPFSAIFPRYDKESFDRAFDELSVAGSRVERVEYLAGNGEIRPAETHARHMLYRNREYACVVLRDVGEREMADLALRQSEERFEAAIRGAEVGIWEWDIKRDTVYQSPQMTAMLEYQDAMLMRDRAAMMARLEPEARARIQTGMEEAVHEHRRFSSEFRHVMKDGGSRWFRIGGAAVYDAEGKATRLAGSVIDITQSKRIELALRAGQVRREVIFQNSPLGILVTRRADGVVTEANDAVLRMMGYSAEKMIGRDTVELGFWPTHEDRKHGLAHLPITHERAFRRPDGEIVFLSQAIEAVELEGEEYLLTSMQDTTERRQKEQALRASEARFARLLEVSPLAILITSLEDGIVLDVNEAFSEVTGLMREEVVGRPVAEMHIWAEADMYAQSAYTLIEYGRVEPRDVAVRRKSGATGYVELSGLLIEIEEQPRALMFMQDITQRKLAEIELLRSRERLSRIIHASPTAMSITDLDTVKVLDVNDAWLRLFGLEREQAIGHSLSELGADVNERAWRLEALRRGVGLRDVDIGCMRSDGENFEARCSFETLLLDGRTVLVSTLTDITEQKRIERELRRRDQLLRQTGAVAEVGGWELDPESGRMQWTEEQYRLHGLEPGNAAPTLQEILDRHDPEPRQKLSAAIDRAVAEGEPFDLELSFHTRKGEQRWGHIQGMAERRDGKTVRLYGAFQDTTETRRVANEIRRLNETLEQRVRERTAELETANRELESFSYSVSHDLRAPLRAMTGFSTILLEEHSAKLDPHASELLGRVSAASQKMADLIDALLQLARVTRQQMARSEIDLAAVAEGIIRDLCEAEPERKVEIKIGADLRVHADPALMRSLLQNLLGNAWKYSAKKEQTCIEFDSTQIDGERVFYVRDRGAGFDMRYAARLFGAFQRLHSPKEFEGTGIGLATVERIVRRHGGRIWGEAQPQQGATFYFTLG